MSRATAFVWHLQMTEWGFSKSFWKWLFFGFFRHLMQFSEQLLPYTANMGELKGFKMLELLFFSFGIKACIRTFRMSRVTWWNAASLSRFEKSEILYLLKKNAKCQKNLRFLLAWWPIGSLRRKKRCCFLRLLVLFGVAGGAEMAELSAKTVFHLLSWEVRLGSVAPLLGAFKLLTELMLLIWVFPPPLPAISLDLASLAEHTDQVFHTPALCPRREDMYSAFFDDSRNH